jgi:hypothetical protein
VWRWNLPAVGGPAEKVAAGPRAIEVTPVSAEEALRHYLDRGLAEGRVIGEVPTKLLLGIRPGPLGGHELIYMRPIIERRRVPELWQVDGEDEVGQPTLVRYGNSGGRGEM